MLFRYPHVERALRIALRKSGQAGAVHHRSGDGHNTVILLREASKRLAEDVGVAGQGMLFLAEPVLDEERRHAMEMLGLSFCQLISFALDGHNLQDDRLLNVLDHVDGFQHLAHVVAINDTKVAEPQLFEHHSWQVQPLEQRSQPSKAASHKGRLTGAQVP